jgi:UDP-3-O-[3-hydroxymyristoyl] glucosamine N-acyltransferase
MYALAEIADRLSGELHGSGELEVGGLGPYDAAEEGQLVVAFDERALKLVEAGSAAAVVVPPGLEPNLPHISVEHPKQALHVLLALFEPPPLPYSGVHPRAEVHPSARLGADCTVGPFAVIEEEAVLGDRCRIGPHSVVGAGARLGDDVLLHAHVTLYAGVRLGDRVVIHSGAAIGGNGYGITMGEGRLRRIPQIGSVVLADDVEIGCNCCVDRSTLGFTRLGAGTKLDNLVQVAHNCRLGENCILAAQTGIAGSSTVGDNVVMGGQVGVADHVNVGSGVQMGAQSGTNRDLPAGAEVTGTMAMPVRTYMQVQVLLPRLRELFRRVDRLEKG